MQFAINYEHDSRRADIVIGLEYVVQVPFDVDEPVTYHRITEMGLLEVDKWDRIDDDDDPMTGTRIILIGSIFTINVSDEGWDIVSADGEQINGGSWDEQVAFDVIV